MTELGLYKFVTKHGCEYHCNSEENIVLFVDINNIREFNNLIGIDQLNDDDGGLDCHMKGGYFGFDMYYFCVNNDIDPNKIFHPKGSDYHREI